jgi:hypothetical protein
MGLAQLSCACVKGYSCHILERLKATRFLQAGIFTFGYDDLCVGIIGGVLCLLSLASNQHGHDN